MFKTINTLAIAVSLSLLGFTQAQAGNVTFDINPGDNLVLSHSVTQDGVTLLIDNGTGGNSAQFKSYDGGLFIDSTYPANLDFTFDQDVQLVSYTISNTEDDGNYAKTFNLTQGSLESLNNSNSALGTFPFTNVNDTFAGTVPISLQSADNDFEGWSISAITVNVVPEPSTALLLCLGLLALATGRWNR